MKKIYSFLLMALLASAAWATTVTFDFAANGNTMFDGITASDTSSDTGDFTQSKSNTQGDVTITVGAGAKMYAVYGGGIELRMYTGSSLTVAAAEGHKITGIEFVNTRWSEPTASNGAFSDAVWSGDAASVTFDFGAQCRLTQLKVTVDNGQGTVDPDPDPEKTVITDFNQMAELEDGTEFEFQGYAIVVYQNGQYLYVRGVDEDSYFCNGLIYGNTGIQYEPGDFIPMGWTATKDTYHGLVEAKNPQGLEQATEVDEYEEDYAPFDETAYFSYLCNLDYLSYFVNDYLVVKGVTLTAPDNRHNFTITLDENTIAGYDRFGAEFPEDLDAAYDVVGVMSVFDETPQIIPISITPNDPFAVQRELWDAWYNGQDGEQFTVADRLYVVKATKAQEPEEQSSNYIYVTDNRTEIEYNYYGYLIPMDWTPDCYAIDCQGNEELYNQIAGMNVIEAGTLRVELASNFTNPRLLVTEAPEEAEVEEAEADPEFMFMNFNLNDTLVADGHLICNIQGVYKVIDGKEYLMGMDENGELWQPIALDRRYIGQAGQPKDGDLVELDQVVIKLNEAWEVRPEDDENAGAPARSRMATFAQHKRAAAQAVKAPKPRKAYRDDDNYYENYILCPLNADFIVTAVNDVETKAAVSSVQYVNVAGQVSNAPFQGVNVVVTRYDNGTVKTGKLVK